MHSHWLAITHGCSLLFLHSRMNLSSYTRDTRGIFEVSEFIVVLPIKVLNGILSSISIFFVIMSSVALSGANAASLSIVPFIFSMLTTDDWTGLCFLLCGGLNGVPSNASSDDLRLPAAQETGNIDKVKRHSILTRSFCRRNLRLDIMHTRHENDHILSFCYFRHSQCTAIMNSMQGRGSRFSLSNCWACIVVFWLVSFGLTRMHMFQHAYSHKLQEHNNNEWLREQCSLSEFYHNMKHHSNICEDVTSATYESIWLNAADHVAQNSYLCGYTPCGHVVEQLFEWLLGGGFVVTFTVCISLLVLPSLFIPFLREKSNSMIDVRRQAMLESPGALQTNSCNPLGVRSL